MDDRSNVENECKRSSILQPQNYNEKTVFEKKALGQIPVFYTPEIHCSKNTVEDNNHKDCEPPLKKKKIEKGSDIETEHNGGKIIQPLLEQQKHGDVKKTSTEVRFYNPRTPVLQNKAYDLDDNEYNEESERVVNEADNNHNDREPSLQIRKKELSSFPIKCKACREELKNPTRRPRFLQCGHSYCDLCVHPYDQQGEYICNLCKTMYQLGPFNDLPVNLDMEEILKMCSQSSAVIIIKEDTIKEAQKIKEHLTFTSCLLQIRLKTFERNNRGNPPEIIKFIDAHAKQLESKLKMVDKSIEKKVVFQGCLALQTRIEILNNFLKDVESQYGSVSIIMELFEEERRYILKLLCVSRIAVYAVDDEDEFSRATKVNKCEWGLKVSSMAKDVIPSPNSCIIEMSSLLSVVGKKPIVYLQLEMGGKHLGIVRIRLTCGIKRRKQMINLCTATDGPTLKNSVFTYAAHIGEEGESTQCDHYVTPDGKECNDPIVKNLEQKGLCKRWVEGAVTGNMNDASFVICTRTNPKDTSKAPKIGEIISGLGLLSNALGQLSHKPVFADDDTRKYDKAYDHYYDATVIRLSEVGVEIPDDECLSR